LNGFDVPDHLGVLINTPVASEETHPSDAGDTLRGPFLLILVLLVDEFLCLAVRRKVVRHQVEVSMLDDAIDESGE